MNKTLIRLENGRFEWSQKLLLMVLKPTIVYWYRAGGKVEVVTGLATFRRPLVSVKGKTAMFKMFSDQ